MQVPSTLWSEIRRVQRGSTEAWQDFYARYRRPVLRYIREHVHGIPEEDCDDLAQTVFLHVSRKGFLERVDPTKGRFRNLLQAVTRNVVNLWLRGEYARRGSLPVLEGLAADDETRSQPDTAFNREWAKNIMEMAFQSLERHSRKLGTPYDRAIRAFYLDNRPYREIAQLLGVTEVEVGNLVARGKAKLRTSIRALIRQYCASPDEIADELRTLEQFLPSDP